MFLIIDASNKDPFLALITSHSVVDIEHLDGLSSLSKILYLSLDILFKRNELTTIEERREIKKVIYGKGPGSFLGTRTAANLASALHCSLGIEVGSFMSPLAYLPFPKGKFAYLMKPKGGKYPMLCGIKKSLGAEIFSTHLFTHLDELLISDKLREIEYLVVDPALKEEIYKRQHPLSFTICEQKLDITFLPILAKAKSNLLDQPKGKQREAEQINPFGLIY